MHIRTLHLKNVRCFEDITVNFKFRKKPEDDPRLNWNVILGDNGDGKTTLLQAIAACLTDSATAGRLMKTDNWVRKGCSKARMSADFVQNKNVSGIPPEKFRRKFTVQYMVVSAGEKIVLSSDGSEKYFHAPAILEPMPDYKNEFEDYENTAKDFRYFSKYFSDRGIGFGYGPFRRISGASEYAGNITGAGKRFQTLFDEGAALTDCEAWLKELQRQALLDSHTDSENSRRNILDNVLKFIENMMPNIDRISIEKEMTFLRQGRQADLDDLSDGYRSMFALTADMLRQIIESDIGYSAIQADSVSAEGIVLIDEIDVHLHPAWQREISFLLTNLFPNIQFIVTSHSPFVAMAAGRGALTILEKDRDSVFAEESVPYVRDWTDQQVITDIFGVSGRSWKTENDLREYESLRFQQQRRS